MMNDMFGIKQFCKGKIREWERYIPFRDAMVAPKENPGLFQPWAIRWNAVGIRVVGKCNYENRTPKSKIVNRMGHWDGKFVNQLTTKILKGFHPTAQGWYNPGTNRPDHPKVNPERIASFQSRRASHRSLSFTFLATFAFLFLSIPFSTHAIDYHADIAPLLRDYCSGCHNELDYDGDFSVETFAALMQGGETENETIIVPGDPAKSFLMRTLRKQSKPAMPPKKEPQLESHELALIEQWIKEGAKGPKPADDKSILATLNVPKIAPKKTSGNLRPSPAPNTRLTENFSQSQNSVQST